MGCGPCNGEAKQQHPELVVAKRSSEGCLWSVWKKRKKRKDYAFRRQFNEKPSIIPGCPGVWLQQDLMKARVCIKANEALRSLQSVRKIINSR